MGTVFSSWAELKFVVTHVAAVREIVFAYLEFKGTPKGSKQVLEFPVVEVWRLRNKKVVDIRPFYYDTHAVWSALK
jgi:hypothetical protein